MTQLREKAEALLKFGATTPDRYCHFCDAELVCDDPNCNGNEHPHYPECPFADLRAELEREPEQVTIIHPPEGPLQEMTVNVAKPVRQPASDSRVAVWVQGRKSYRHGRV